MFSFLKKDVCHDTVKFTEIVREKSHRCKLSSDETCSHHGSKNCIEDVKRHTFELLEVNDVKKIIAHRSHQINIHNAVWFCHLEKQSR